MADETIPRAARVPATPAASGEDLEVMRSQLRMQMLVISLFYGVTIGFVLGWCAALLVMR